MTTVDSVARPSDDAIHCICQPQVPPGRPAHWHERQDCPALLLEQMENHEPAPPQVAGQTSVQAQAAGAVADLYPAAQQTAAAPYHGQTTAVAPAAPEGWHRAQQTPEPDYEGIRIQFADVECRPTPEPNPENGRITLKVRRIALKILDARWVENQAHPKYGPPKRSHTYVVDCEILPQGPEYADWEGMTGTIWCSQAQLHTAMPKVPMGMPFLLERTHDLGQSKRFEFYWPNGTVGPF